MDLAALSCALLVGVVALSSNHRRLINRIFFLLSLLTAAWLASRRSAMLGEDAVFWIRVTNAVGAFFPAVFAILKYSVLNEGGSFRATLRHSWVWIFSSLFLSLITFSGVFIPPGSTAQSPQWGWGYYLYISAVGFSFIYLFFLAVLEVGRSRGVKRLELQLLLIGGSGSAAIVLGLMLIKRFSGDDSWLSRTNIQPMVAMAFYAVVVYSMTNHKILDAAQIIVMLVKKGAVVTVAASCFFVSDAVLGALFSNWVSLCVCVALVLWVSSQVEILLERRVKIFSPRTGAREVFFEIAKQELNADGLESRFRLALKDWAKAEDVFLLSIPKSQGAVFETAVDSRVVETIRELKWFTPERLSRERASPERYELGRFLAERRLGVLLVGEGPSFMTLVGAGIGSSRRPYTYPQVVELMELAAIMESALERAHFAAKVQRTEQLATVGLVGASLAHEIRNPLVSIKTFVQLLPTHYADPAFREKFFRLIGDEVARIDELTQQLLDLAAPRSYQAESVGLHGVLRPGLELVEARAAERGVKVVVAFTAEPDTVFTDASAAKQVLLNLCFNAIQAVEAKGGTERWVRLSTRRLADGVELAVSDSGPGIAPEMQRRLFQPFQTTKSRGFGLGLAICRDILANVRATIAVDPALAGQGATFRVTFPCQAPSS